MCVSLKEGAAFMDMFVTPRLLACDLRVAEKFSAFDMLASFVIYRS